MVYKYAAVMLAVLLCVSDAFAEWQMRVDFTDVDGATGYRVYADHAKLADVVDSEFTINADLIDKAEIAITTLQGDYESVPVVIDMPQKPSGFKFTLEWTE